jgi:iron complex outermembrane receptor protein
MVVGWLLAALVAGSLVFCVLVIVAAVKYVRVRPPRLERTEPVSILKPLAGAEDGLSENLRSFFTQDYPEFEILFAVRHPDDPAVPVVERLREEFPTVPSRLIVTGEPPYPNAKVYSLSAMTETARYSLLAMSDSDIRVTPGFLRTVVAEFQDPKLGVTTCPYRAVPGASFWSKMEAIGMNTEFLAGILVARMLEGMKFAVGPTIVARKEAIAKIGGWARVQDYLAEDFVLGQFAAEAGCGVALSSYVIEHHIGSQGLRANAGHRLRWQRSTRRSRPAGYIGQLFTNPLPLAALMLAVSPGLWPLASVTLVGRYAAAWAVSERVLRDPLCRRLWWLIPIQDMISFLFWVLGFFGNTITWRGRSYYLHRDGKFTRVAPMMLVLALWTSALVAQQPAQEKKEDVRKDAIVVTGTYEPVPLEEADRAVRSFEVKGEGELTANTIVDFLNRDSSIDLRQRGQNNIQTDVSIRGGTFGQTLVLLDGMRLNDVQSGHHNMDIPAPVEAVERIEVLKGSGSTLYGSDAVGGVIHFISRAPEGSEVRLRAAGGNFGVHQERVTATLARPRWSEQLSASRDFSSGFIPNRDYRNTAISSITRANSRIGDTRLTLALADKPFGAEQFYGNFNSWERTKTWYAALHQNFDERTQASFGFRRHTDLFVLYRDRPQVFTNHHIAESYQGAFRRSEPLGTNAKVHWGLEGLRDRIESTNLGNHTRSRGAGYAALDVRALRRFSFSLGLREEIYGSVDSQLSPTASAGVWLNSRMKLRGSVSRAFRLPSFTDLYYHDPANLGSPDLRPEKAFSYEGGLDWNAGGVLRGEITVFHRRETDGIDYVRRSATDIWRATNFQRLRFTGVEAGITARVRRVHVFDFRYTGLHGAQNQLSDVFSKYTFNYPSQIGVAGWQAVLPGGLVARTRVGAVQRYARDVYAVADVYLARSAGRVHPFIQLTNLSGTTYQEIFGVAMPGRGIVGGVELSVWRGR